MLFDSHANVKGSLLKYDSVHDNQVEWYKNSIEELSSPESGFAEGEVAPSLVFTHIPLNEFQYAWDDYCGGGTDSEYLWGVMDEKILAPATGKKYPEPKLFDAILKLGSTKAVFCGHNRKNNFAIKI